MHTCYRYFIEMKTRRRQRFDWIWLEYRLIDFNRQIQWNCPPQEESITSFHVRLKEHGRWNTNRYFDWLIRLTFNSSRWSLLFCSHGNWKRQSWTTKKPLKDATILVVFKSPTPNGKTRFVLVSQFTVAYTKITSCKRTFLWINLLACIQTKRKHVCLFIISKRSQQFHEFLLVHHVGRDRWRMVRLGGANFLRRKRHCSHRCLLQCLGWRWNVLKARYWWNNVSAYCNLEPYNDKSYRMCNDNRLENNFLRREIRSLVGRLSIYQPRIYSFSICCGHVVYFRRNGWGWRRTDHQRRTDFQNRRNDDSWKVHCQYAWYSKLASDWCCMERLPIHCIPKDEIIQNNICNRMDSMDSGNNVRNPFSSLFDVRWNHDSGISARKGLTTQHALSIRQIDLLGIQYTHRMVLLQGNR